MSWVLGVVAITVVAGIAYSATQHHMDSRAEQLQQGDDEARQAAGELREISRKIDQGKYLYR